MPTLDNLGKISAATMVLYIPILIIAAILVFRHGFTRDAGWIFIAIFSFSKLYLCDWHFVPVTDGMQPELSVEEC